MKVVRWIGKSWSRNSNMGLPATPYLQVVKGSRDLLLEFWDPFHISGMIQAIKLKFGMNIDHEGL